MFHSAQHPLDARSMHTMTPALVRLTHTLDTDRATDTSGRMNLLYDGKAPRGFGARPHMMELTTRRGLGVAVAN